MKEKLHPFLQDENFLKSRITFQQPKKNKKKPTTIKARKAKFGNSFNLLGSSTSILTSTFKENFQKRTPSYSQSN